MIITVKVVIIIFQKSRKRSSVELASTPIDILGTSVEIWYTH